MANLTFEIDFLDFRTIRPLLDLIRVYPRVSAADFFFVYQSSVAFNSFQVPEIDGNIVVFRESPDYLRKKIAFARVERGTGKIIDRIE
jgi:hypothetical protein